MILPARHIDLSIAALAFAGPVAWFVSTALNYFFAAMICGEGGRLAVLVSAVVLVLVSFASAWLSYRYWRSVPGQSTEDPTSHFPRRMLAGIGVLSGILFAAVILLQASAAAFIASCTA
jgi:hypothetical protein